VIIAYTEVRVAATKKENSELQWKVFGTDTTSLENSGLRFRRKSTFFNDEVGNFVKFLQIDQVPRNLKFYHSRSKIVATPLHDVPSLNHGV